MSVEMFQFTVASAITFVISIGVCVFSPKVESAKLSKQMTYAIYHHSGK